MNITIVLGEEASRLLLPEMQDWLRRICQEIGAVLEIPDWRNKDDFSFMGILFLSKQLDHAESLLQLVPRKDTVLIARTMAEGLVQFLWASREPEIRAHQWRAYSVIEDFNSIELRTRQGDPPSEDMMKSIREALSEVGPLFYKKKARTALDAGKPLPESPYYPSWRKDVTITNVFEEVGGGDLRKFFYGPYSAWAHWSSVTFADRLSNGSSRQTTWTPVAESFAAAAVVVAIMCVLQTAAVLFQHLEIDGADLPGRLRDDFTAWHRTAIDKLKEVKP